MSKPTIDTHALIFFAVLAILVLIAAWYITALPPGVMWWQTFR